MIVTRSHGEKSPSFSIMKRSPPKKNPGSGDRHRGPQVLAVWSWSPGPEVRALHGVWERVLYRSPIGFPNGDEDVYLAIHKNLWKSSKCRVDYRDPIWDIIYIYIWDNYNNQNRRDGHPQMVKSKRVFPRCPKHSILGIIVVIWPDTWHRYT